MTIWDMMLGMWPLALLLLIFFPPARFVLKVFLVVILAFAPGSRDRL